MFQFLILMQGANSWELTLVWLSIREYAGLKLLIYKYNII